MKPENRAVRDQSPPAAVRAAGTRGAAAEVLRAFLKLGLLSFGGPVAHIGYFREEFVARRRWLDDSAFSELVGLCQFLPGPASSQLGFSIGLLRAGYPGALAAWAGFTLPSAAALGLLGGLAGAGAAQRSAFAPLAAGLVHGLKLVAVAIVAQALWGMARTLCPDRTRAAIALVAAAAMWSASSSAMQMAVLLGGGLLGRWLCRSAPSPRAVPRFASPVSRGIGIASLAAFAALLAGLPLLRGSSTARMVDAFYRSGALVFGGGHVVLPLLREAFVAPGWVSEDVFLAGYGAAQAVPGPLFTFAAYLGAVAAPESHRVAGAILGVAAIFLPGFLILLGALPFWDRWRVQAGTQAVMRGVNAAVVGLLGAALINPIWVGSVSSAADAGAALTGFLLLTVWRLAPVWVVVLGAAAGAVRSGLY